MRGTCLGEGLGSPTKRNSQTEKKRKKRRKTKKEIQPSLAWRGEIWFNFFWLEVVGNTLIHEAAILIDTPWRWWWESPSIDSAQGV